MTATVRQATLADIPVIVEFNCCLADETEGIRLDRDAVTRGVTAVLADANKGIYFVAEANGTVIATTEITYEWSDWRNGWFWWIQSVYVRAEARRQGVFRALYHHIHRAACQDSQVIGLRLYVEHQNHRAQQTYESLSMKPAGYRVYERYPL